MSQVCVNKKVEDEGGQVNGTHVTKASQTDCFFGKLRPNLVQFFSYSHDKDNKALLPCEDCQTRLPAGEKTVIREGRAIRPRMIKHIPLLVDWKTQYTSASLHPKHLQRSTKKNITER